MDVHHADLKIERIRGKGPGGQHKNKTCSMVRMTHIPTGISVQADGRCQHQNTRKCFQLLGKALKKYEAEQRAAKRKAERDRKVKNAGPHRRTYDETANRVTDHRKNVKKLFNDVVKHGNLDDLLDF